VYVTHYLISRPPEYYRDPEEFHPERWLEAEKYKNDNFAAFDLRWALELPGKEASRSLRTSTVP